MNLACLSYSISKDSSKNWPVNLNFYAQTLWLNQIRCLYQNCNRQILRCMGSLYLFQYFENMFHLFIWHFVFHWASRRYYFIVRLLISILKLRFLLKAHLFLNFNALDLLVSDDSVILIVNIFHGLYHIIIVFQVTNFLISIPVLFNPLLFKLLLFLRFTQFPVI